QVRFHLVLVARVRVHDVPASGPVEGAELRARRRGLDVVDGFDVDQLRVGEIGNRDDRFTRGFDRLVGRVVGGRLGVVDLDLGGSHLLAVVVVRGKLEGLDHHLNTKSTTWTAAQSYTKISVVITTRPISTTSEEFRISARGGHATFFISPRTSPRYCPGPVRSTCGFGADRRSGARGRSDP